jgi:hypothetical protein
MRILRSWFLVLIALLLLLGCAARDDSLPQGEDFGAGVTLEEATPLAEIVGDPARFADDTVLIRGEVTEVCQKKGCWAMIRAGDAQVQMRFKDYGFFLPKDCVGAEAYAEGSVSAEGKFTATGVRLVRGD